MSISSIPRGSPRTTYPRHCLLDYVAQGHHYVHSSMFINIICNFCGLQPPPPPPVSLVHLKKSLLPRSYAKQRSLRPRNNAQEE